MRPPAAISTALVLLLAMMTGLEALSIDIILPAFGPLAQALETTESRAALTLTIFVIGMAIGQVIWAPLIDSWGRRGPTLVGIGCFVVASVFCALAGQLELLLLGRLLQGLAAAVAIIVPRVVVADLADEPSQARIHSTLMQVFLLVPVVAPLLGSALLGVMGWRGLFWALAGGGTAVWLWAALALPETLERAHRRPVSLKSALRSHGALMTWPFANLLMINAALTAALFAYLGKLAGALTVDFGYSPGQISAVLALNAAGLILAAGLNRRLLRRRSPGYILTRGAVMGLASASLLTAFATLWPGLPAAVLLPMLFPAVAALSLTFPNLTAITMTAADAERGSGAALVGLAQNLGGGLIGSATFLLGGGMAGLGLALALPTLLALVLWMLHLRPFTQQGYGGRPAPRE